MIDAPVYHTSREFSDELDDLISKHLSGTESQPLKAMGVLQVLLTETIRGFHGVKLPKAVMLEMASQMFDIYDDPSQGWAVALSCDGKGGFTVEKLRRQDPS